MVSGGSAPKELAGSAATVTGIIGGALAMSLADAGTMVLINARTSGDAAAAVVEEIEVGGGTAVAHLATSPSRNGLKPWSVPR